MNFHDIQPGKYWKTCPIRKKKFKFALFNRGVICGDRLFKGNDVKASKGTWPFTDPDWMFANTLEAAQAAAKKLQAYLNAREAAKAKNKK